MGEVFLAAATGKIGLSPPVALKVLRRELAVDPAFVQMIIDEARISMFLNHQNIVSVLDFAEEAGAYYIAMEYVHGPTVERLADQLRKSERQLDLSVGLYVGVELLRALKYAHACVNHLGEPLNIIHRDVTPANVLLSVQGEVKLTDFGIARAKGRLHETQAGVVKGKFGYLAPEVTRYERIDARADLFSAGVLLFHLFAARHPVQGASIMEAIFRFEEKRIPKPSDFNPQVSPALDAVVLKALEPNPDDRYGSAQEIIEALQQIMGSTPELRRATPMGAQLLADTVRSLFPELNEDPVSAARRELKSPWSGGAVGAEPTERSPDYADRATRIVPGDSVLADPGTIGGDFGDKTETTAPGLEDPAPPVPRLVPPPAPRPLERLPSTDATEPVREGGDREFGGRTAVDGPPLMALPIPATDSEPRSVALGFDGATQIEHPSAPDPALAFGDRTRVDGAPPPGSFGEATQVDHGRREPPGFGDRTRTYEENLGFGGATRSYSQDVLPQLVQASEPSGSESAEDVLGGSTELFGIEESSSAHPLDMADETELDPIERSRPAPGPALSAPRAPAPARTAAQRPPVPPATVRDAPPPPSRSSPREGMATELGVGGPPKPVRATAAEIEAPSQPTRRSTLPPPRVEGSTTSRPLRAALPTEYAALVEAPLAEPLGSEPPPRNTTGLSATHVRAPAERPAAAPAARAEAPGEGFGSDTAKWMSGQKDSNELSWSDDDAARRAVATRHAPARGARSLSSTQPPVLAADTLPVGEQLNTPPPGARASTGTPTPLVALTKGPVVRPRGPTAVQPIGAEAQAKGARRWLLAVLLILALALGTTAGVLTYPRMLRPTVRIESHPAGASVFINGQPLREPAPVEVVVEPGQTQEIELSLEGYEPSRLGVPALERGQSYELDARLVRVVTELELQPRARVLVNDHLVGEGERVRLSNIDPAEPVELKLEAEGYQTKVLKYARGTKLPKKLELTLEPL